MHIRVSHKVLALKGVHRGNQYKYLFQGVSPLKEEPYIRVYVTQPNLWIAIVYLYQACVQCVCPN